MTTSTFIIIGLLGGGLLGLLIYIVYTATAEKEKTRKDLILTRGSNKADLESEKVHKKEKNKGGVVKKLKNTVTTASNDLEPMGPKSIPYMLIQAGVEMHPAQYWFYSILSCLGFFVFGLMFFSDNYLAIVLLIVIGFLGFPYFILSRKVKKRQKKILTELPDCLDGMVRLLKSGMPVSEAIAMTSRQNKGPIGEEMTKIYEAQRIGDTLPEAVEKFAFRVPLPEVKMFSTAITIQVKTGASLSEILMNLSAVIRDRFKLKRKVKALSAEAKASAGIIGSLPIVMVTAVYFVNPQYIELLWTTDTGMFFIYIAFGWMSLGVIVMKQMISFKI